MKKAISIIMSIVIIFSFAACSSMQKTANEKTQQFNTIREKSPTDASEESTVIQEPSVSNNIMAQDVCVLAYLNALKENDADRIIQISSSSRAGNATGEQIGSDFIGELVSISSVSQIMTDTWFFIYSVLSDLDPDELSKDWTEETIALFIRDIDPARLADIKVLQFGSPLTPSQIPYGIQADASAICQRFCLFSIGDKLFCQNFWLVNTPEGYRLAYIGEYSNNSFGYTGNANPVSRDEFKALIDPRTVNEPSQELLSSSVETGCEPTFLQNIKRIASPLLENPEDAIDSFVAAVAMRDPYAAISAFDVKEEAEKADIYKLTERLQVFKPYDAGFIIPAYDFFRDINLAMNCAEKAEYIVQLIASFSIENVPDLTVEQYLLNLQKNCTEVESLSVIRSDVFAKTTSDYFHDLNERQAALYGADYIEHRIIEYSFDGEKYTGAVMLIDYGGNWRIQELASVLFSSPSSPILVISSDQIDYDSFI